MLLLALFSCVSSHEPSLAYDVPFEGHTMSFEEWGGSVAWSESSFRLGKIDLHISSHHLSTALHDDTERERVLQESLQDPPAMLASLSTNPRTIYRHRIVRNARPGIEIGFVDEATTRVVRVLVGDAYVVVVWADAREAGVTLEELAARLDLMNVREPSSA
jgi:hypothetical protein